MPHIPIDDAHEARGNSVKYQTWEVVVRRMTNRLIPRIHGHSWGRVWHQMCESSGLEVSNQVWDQIAPSFP